MKFFSFVSSLILASAASAAGTASRPLRFDRAPLGNVARVLSARFHAPITIEARATAPITGNFTGLPLRQALDRIAAQAGLTAVALGKGDGAGFALRMAPPAAPAAGPAPGERAALLKRREELLRREAALEAAARPPP